MIIVNDNLYAIASKKDTAYAVNAGLENWLSDKVGNRRGEERCFGIKLQVCMTSLQI